MMDIGNLKNNYTYYDGYEGECEVILYIQEHEEFNLHIWDGYFEEVFGNPEFTEDGWIGFTRDYQESVNTFSDEDCILVNLSEYIEDLNKCLVKRYEEETSNCLNLLLNFINFAKENNYAIVARIS